MARFPEQNPLKTNSVDILLPPNFITFPLSPSDFENLVGIDKSTLFRWERDGWIPRIPQVKNGLRMERQIEIEDLKKIFSAMKEMREGFTGARRWSEKAAYPAFPWLENFNPEKPCLITTEKGVTFKFNGDH